MSNAAIYYHPDAFDTSTPNLMGRQAAGEGFLRGFIRHADVDRFYFSLWTNHSIEKSEALVRRIEPTAKPIQWITRQQMGRLAEPGCLFISSPANAQEAWNRRLVGPNRYSICGLTHTTCSQNAMDGLIAMLHSPVEPWDALICTSRSVTQSTATQLGLAMDYFRERFGPVATPPIRLETIPLGINAGDFARSETHRAHWRQRLGVEDDAIVVLYVGRFSIQGKMNPAPMAMALERAAQRTKRPIHWVLSGWASSPQLHKAFVEAGPRHAPSVTTHILDGRLEEVRFPIWSAGDIFFSLSDNIQETFGLTPVEAMAAGLPSVVSDWDGYRELLEHGVQGFHVPTMAPLPGRATDIAVAFANDWLSYDRYVGVTSQFVSVDLDAATEALVQLIENDDLRRRMGAAAVERARTEFDWKTVIGQYQALWADLDAIRKAAPVKPRGGLSPWRPDPFELFASYPTRALQPDATMILAPGATVEAVHRMLDDPTVSYNSKWLARPGEFAAVVELLRSRPKSVAEILTDFHPGRRGMVERGLLWLMKFGFIRAASPSGGAPD